MIGRFAFTFVLLLLAVGFSGAQQQTLRITGVVESFDGTVLAIRSDKLGEVKVSLAANATVFGVAEAKSRNVWRRSSTGANAAALSSDAGPGVTLTISSAASANS